MDKRIRKSIMVIISMVLILVMLGVSFAWGDESDKENRDDPREITVTITFDAQGGSCDITEIEETPGYAYVSLPVPTRNGYVFTGWYETTDSEEYEITSDSIIPFHNVDLYAHWGKMMSLVNIGSSKCLNIYGSNITSLYDGMNVTVWSNSGSNEQKWLIHSMYYDFYVKSYVDHNYGLNVYRAGNPWNCNVHQIIGNEVDAQVYRGWASGGNLVFFLTNYNLALTSAGDSDGSNVHWEQFSFNTYKYWNYWYW